MWSQGETLRVFEGFSPLPALREGTDRAAEARLADYLDRLMPELLPLPSSQLPLFLHLHIQIPRETNLLHGYSLMDYLIPLFGSRRLNATRFSLVVGTKSMTAPSSISLGVASPTPRSAAPKGWSRCRATPAAAPTSLEWVEQLRRALGGSIPVPLAEGPVRLQIHLRCSPDRNWVGLWKPAGDALGPVLGYDRSGNPYNPRDDHLTRIEYHRQTDQRLGNVVEVGYFWAKAQPEG